MRASEGSSGHAPATVSALKVFVSKPFTSSASSQAMPEPTVPDSTGAPAIVLRKCLTLVSTGDAMWFSLSNQGRSTPMRTSSSNESSSTVSAPICTVRMTTNGKVAAMVLKRITEPAGQPPEPKPAAGIVM